MPEDFLRNTYRDSEGDESQGPVKFRFIRLGPRYPSQPTVEQALQDPTIKKALDKAWADTHRKDPNGKVIVAEQGGHIVWNKKTGDIRVIRAEGGTPTSMPGSVFLKSRPPFGADEEEIAGFHTHPNRVASPSKADKAFAKHYGRPEVIVYGPENKYNIYHP
jgi:proteasome lid subunit RPN8/RPN11